MQRPFFVFLALALAVPFAHAGSDKNAARWFRYYDDHHHPNVTDVVTPEHVSHGYDELTANMQLIRHVPPQRALTPAEIAAAKAKREAELEQAKVDKQLLRLYSGPADAEQARKRQLDTLQLRIDFSSNSLINLRKQRAAEAKKAATSQRTGRPTPAELRDTIADYDKQIRSAEAEIAARKAEQEKVRAEFAPIIQRLQELTGQPADPNAAPTAAAAAPATPAPASP